MDSMDSGEKGGMFEFLYGLRFCAGHFALTFAMMMVVALSLAVALGQLVVSAPKPIDVDRWLSKGYYDELQAEPLNLPDTSDDAPWRCAVFMLTAAMVSAMTIAANVRFTKAIVRARTCELNNENAWKYKKEKKFCVKLRTLMEDKKFFWYIYAVGQSVDFVLQFLVLVEYGGGFDWSAVRLQPDSVIKFQCFFLSVDMIASPVILLSNSMLAATLMEVVCDLGFMLSRMAHRSVRKAGLAVLHVDNMGVALMTAYPYLLMTKSIMACDLYLLRLEIKRIYVWRHEEHLERTSQNEKDRQSFEMKAKASMEEGAAEEGACAPPAIEAAPPAAAAEPAKTEAPAPKADASEPAGAAEPILAEATIVEPQPVAATGGAALCSPRMNFQHLQKKVVAVKTVQPDATLHDIDVVEPVDDEIWDVPAEPIQATPSQKSNMVFNDENRASKNSTASKNGTSSQKQSSRPKSSVWQVFKNISHAARRQSSKIRGASVVETRQIAPLADTPLKKGLLVGFLLVQVSLAIVLVNHVFSVLDGKDHHKACADLMDKYKLSCSRYTYPIMGKDLCDCVQVEFYAHDTQIDDRTCYPPDAYAGMPFRRMEWIIYRATDAKHACQHDEHLHSVFKDNRGITVLSYTEYRGPQQLLPDFSKYPLDNLVQIYFGDSQALTSLPKGMDKLRSLRIADFTLGPYFTYKEYEQNPPAPQAVYRVSPVDPFCQWTDDAKRPNAWKRAVAGERIPYPEISGSKRLDTMRYNPSKPPPDVTVDVINCGAPLFPELDRCLSHPSEFGGMYNLQVAAQPCWELTEADFGTECSDIHGCMWPYGAIQSGKGGWGKYGLYPDYGFSTDFYPSVHSMFDMMKSSRGSSRFPNLVHNLTTWKCGMDAINQKCNQQRWPDLNGVFQDWPYHLPLQLISAAWTQELGAGTRTTCTACIGTDDTVYDGSLPNVWNQNAATGKFEGPDNGKYSTNQEMIDTLQRFFALCPSDGSRDNTMLIGTMAILRRRFDITRDRGDSNAAGGNLGCYSSICHWWREFKGFSTADIDGDDLSYTMEEWNRLMGPVNEGGMGLVKDAAQWDCLLGAMSENDGMWVDMTAKKLTAAPLFSWFHFSSAINAFCKFCRFEPSQFSHRTNVPYPFKDLKLYNDPVRQAAADAMAPPDVNDQY